MEVNDRNGFEAWRRLVLEMERDTVNRNLVVIESLSRPDFGVDLTQWRQRWKRWEREMRHYMPQVGTAMTEAMRIAIVRQDTGRAAATLEVERDELRRAVRGLSRLD